MIHIIWCTCHVQSFKSAGRRVSWVG